MKDPTVGEDPGLCMDADPSGWQMRFSILGLQEFLFKDEGWIMQ